MPSTTALTSSFDMYAEIAGMIPAITVTANRPVVIVGLASQTSRMTLGSAAAVPRTDCLRLRQRPRRSFGPSGCWGSSMTGSPVRPLLAGPLSAILGRPRPHIQNIDGPLCPGGIIPTALPYRTAGSRSLSESHRVLDAGEPTPFPRILDIPHLRLRKGSSRRGSIGGLSWHGGSDDQSTACRSRASREPHRYGPRARRARAGAHRADPIRGQTADRRPGRTPGAAADRAPLRRPRPTR